MIHPNVCFLILLICCWVVTASLMAEKTNVGVAVFVADNTYVCGCGSDGAAALLSACSLVRCCSHQFGFPSLEVLLQGTPPPCTISCKTLPGHSVDADSRHISCADIFISQVRAASGSPPQCQLTVEDVFWDATILHTANMTQPTQSALSEQGVYSGKTGTRQDISVGYFVPPRYAQDKGRYIAAIMMCLLFLRCIFVAVISNCVGVAIGSWMMSDLMASSTPPPPYPSCLSFRRSE